MVLFAKSLHLLSQTLSQGVELSPSSSHTHNTPPSTSHTSSPSSLVCSWANIVSRPTYSISNKSHCIHMKVMLTHKHCKAIITLLELVCHAMTAIRSELFVNFC